MRKQIVLSALFMSVLSSVAFAGTTTTGGPNAAPAIAAKAPAQVVEKTDPAATNEKSAPQKKYKRKNHKAKKTSANVETTTAPITTPKNTPVAKPAIQNTTTTTKK